MLINYIRLEIHYDEMHVEQSILLKLVFARCVNTALLIYIIVPPEEMFSLQNIEKIQNVLISDAITTPLIRIMNIPGYFSKYVIGYFSTSQEELNSKWKGGQWTLAERYTDVLKSVFTGLFFFVPLPSALFITCFNMLTTYVVDKYSLYRVWIRKPAISGDLSVVARHFFYATIWVHLHISLKFFANWPYKELWQTNFNENSLCSGFTCDPTP